MTLKIVAIIQARMNSSRLPGKVLLPLKELPVLSWLMNRCSSCSLIDRIIIATTTDPSNDPIAEMYPYSTFRYEGDEDDVIGRVLAAAKYTKAVIIVDITGDCPMADPRHIERMIDILTDRKVDYVSNCIERTWPDGLDIQVYWTKALESCIALFHPKQHAGWNIAQHPEVFQTLNWPAPKRFHWPELGLTLDTPEDYQLLQILFEVFGETPTFSVETVMEYLRNNPHLVEINKNVKRKVPEEG